MPGKKSTRIAGARTFLGALARDVRGNTLAIMAAALIPLAGLVGGGIDISRMYITKTRLQHACDAGALAGRKAMGGGVWGTDDNGVAQQFFDANFQNNADHTGAYGSSAVSRNFVESAGKVSGSAQATLPMTLMRVLGKTQDTLIVACDAEMRLPNTDVMFVLDVTGSMNCVAGDTSCTNNGGVPASGSKIGGLKTAVKCFYEIVARLPTNATCATAKPSGGTGDQVQIRFGFVPYASNVNVGYLLPTSYFANSWKYQSRQIIYWTPNGSANNNTTSGTASNYSSNSCSNIDDNNTSSDTYNSNYTTRTIVGTTYTKTGYNSNSKICSYNKTVTTTTYRQTTTPTSMFTWHYGQISQDISGLKNGSTWNTSFQLPMENDGSKHTFTWDGCIEERQTVRATDYDPIPSGAKDLNIDLVPTQGDATTLWGPALPDMVYWRQITSQYSQASTDDVPSTTTNYYDPGLSDYCPSAAKKLQAWPNATSFDTYVDGLIAQGNTYHDIGMLWGARLMSPTGIFASENALTPEGGDIQRNLIFMTDGDSTSSVCDYNAYGSPWFDQRETTDVGSLSVCGTNTPNRQQLIDQINLRLATLCTAVKNMNITLWVVSYGGVGINDDTKNRLSTCASDGKYFDATDPTKLQTTFASIANQISALRLTK